MSAYGYIDQQDGLALCRVLNRSTCHVFVTDEGVSIRKHPLLPVPKRFLAARRAPNVIWKPDASTDVTSAVEVEMVDLSGGLGAPHELSPADQVFMIFGGGLFLLMIGAVVGVAARMTPDRD